MSHIVAYCWATGAIEFGDNLPQGALPLIRGEEQSVRETVGTLATRSKQGGQLLIPKSMEWIRAIQTADPRVDEHALDCVFAFKDRLVLCGLGKHK